METQGTTFLFGTASNSQTIASYKFWNKIKIGFSQILKGFKPF
jgi:hypothetical protein